MGYNSMRDFLMDIDSHGELKRVNGAHWDLEMSSIAEILYREGKRPVPALLFDDIPGYPKGYRALFGLLSSPLRFSKALSLSLPEKGTSNLSVVDGWRRKKRDLKPIPPTFVSSGPVQENYLTGDTVDITKFPSPRCHELDTSRYIGTGNGVIIRDPDTGWVNIGTYRCMLVDHNRMALHMLASQHGRIICDKYFVKGQTIPIAVAIGMDPTLYFASTQHVPWGVSEYDYAGGIKGESIEVFKGPYTGLPLPANSEIVIEGECHPGEYVDEGPFGEWSGYYGNLGLTPVPEPVIHVKAVYHRHDPILNSSSPAVPPGVNSPLTCWGRAGIIWDSLDSLGIPGVKGVWCHEEGGAHYFNVVSIEQKYSGHSREVGLIASQRAGNTGRYTIVVDEDIDPSDLSQVIWAVSMRTNPERSIQILTHCVTSSADTMISPEEKRKVKTTPKPLHASRAVIDACQPYEWKSEWYPVARASPELRSQLIKKWESIFKEFAV